MEFGRGASRPSSGPSGTGHVKGAASGSEVPRLSTASDAGSSRFPSEGVTLARIGPARDSCPVEVATAGEAWRRMPPPMRIANSQALRGATGGPDVVLLKFILGATYVKDRPPLPLAA